VTAPPSEFGSLDLAGVDGTNPLGFLAALGTLVTARSAGEANARLRWKRARTWIPMLEGISSGDPARLSETLAEALRGKTVSPAAEQKRLEADNAFKNARTAVNSKIKEIKRQGLKRAERKAFMDAHLRPLERECHSRRHDWLRALRDAVPRPELALGARIDCTDDEYRQHASALRDESGHASREPLDLLSAFGSDACRKARSDAIEPTPFCFIKGGGHQDFLDTVRQLIAKVTSERIRQTLFQPWDYGDPGLSMRWDPTEDKRYALTDVKPADEGASTVWMANLLAYRALALFASAPTRRGLRTTGWTLVDDREVFTWPIWDLSAGPETIRSLLQLQELAKQHPDRSTLRTRGVTEVFRARRIKVGTGSNFKLNFSPARAV
jgi:hypothetical protein